MKQITRTIKKWIGAVAIAALAPAAMAGGIANGTFVSDLSFWSTSGGPVTFDGAVGRAALGSALFDAVSPANTGKLFQSVNISGFDTLIFWVRALEPGDFAVTFGGVGIGASATGLLEIGADTKDWAEWSAKVSGSSSDTLAFSGTVGIDPDKAFFIDDVSLNCLSTLGCNGGTGNKVPEPGSLLLVGAALAAGALVRRRKQA